MSPMIPSLACLLALQAAKPAPVPTAECELADKRCQAAKKQAVAAAASKSPIAASPSEATTTTPRTSVAVVETAPHAPAPVTPAADTAGATDTAALSRDTRVRAGDAATAGASPEGTASAGAVGPSAAREEQRDRVRLRIGMGTLVSGSLLLVPMAGLLGYRAAGERELEVLNLDTAGRPTSDAEDAAAAALGQRYTNTTAGVIVLGVTSGALVVTGAVFLAMGARPRRVAVAPWGARGLGGLVLEGSF